MLNTNTRTHARKVARLSHIQLVFFSFRVLMEKKCKNVVALAKTESEPWKRSGQIWYGIEYGLFALWEWFAQHFELVNIWLSHFPHRTPSIFYLCAIANTHNATKKQTLTHNNNQQKRMPFSLFISNRFYAWISISFSDDFLISWLLFVLICFPLLVGYPKLFSHDSSVSFLYSKKFAYFAMDSLMRSTLSLSLSFCLTR